MANIKVRQVTSNSAQGISKWLNCQKECLGFSFLGQYQVQKSVPPLL